MNDAVHMFAINCPQHGARVLVGPSRIRAFHNTANGIYLSVECYCGQRTAIATGRTHGSTPHPTPVLAAA